MRISDWSSDVCSSDLPAQLGAVFEALYPELRRLANSRMYGNESTFTPTVLVHELFLRITQGSPLALADRNHFFAASAKAMRRNFCFGADCTRAQRRDARWPHPAAKTTRYTRPPLPLRQPHAA